jgi:hypothetical protein
MTSLGICTQILRVSEAGLKSEEIANVLGLYVKAVRQRIEDFDKGDFLPSFSGLVQGAVSGSTSKRQPSQ